MAERFVSGEEIRNIGHLQQGADSLIEADKDHAAAGLLGGEKSADQGADAGGIDIGDFAKIEDLDLVRFRAHCRLKVEEIVQGQRSSKMEDLFIFAHP